MLEHRGPAYRIETERLVLRCWSPTDAGAARRALDASDQHLRPYIPFMRFEPRTVPETAHWLRTHRAAFDDDRYYRYAVFDGGESDVLGETMLLDRHGDGTWELGYWQHVDHGGHGYATEAAAAVVRIGFELHSLPRLRLVCSDRNRASAALAARLGFEHEATLRRELVDTEDAVHDAMLWTLFADDYPATRAVHTALRAFDCRGERVL